PAPHPFPTRRSSDLSASGSSGAILGIRTYPWCVTSLALADAMKEAGCPVCRIGAERVEAAQRSFLHELVNDPGARAEVIGERGLDRKSTRLNSSHLV